MSSFSTAKDATLFNMVSPCLQSDVVEVVSKKWEEFQSQLSPAVCLVVGSFDSESKEAQTNQQEILGWCVENAFELIEWEKAPPSPASHSRQEGRRILKTRWSDLTHFSFFFL